MNNKLILGTAQMGLDYGINNLSGKVSKNKSIEILEYAFDNGIRILDTAEVYGNAHEIIGFYHKLNPNKKFNKAHADMVALEKGAIANPDEDRMVGHYWLRNSDLAPTVELKETIDNNEPIERVDEEFGDVLFSLINYARFINVNPETVLLMK